MHAFKGGVRCYGLVSLAVPPPTPRASLPRITEYGLRLPLHHHHQHQLHPVDARPADHTAVCATLVGGMGLEPSPPTSKKGSNAQEQANCTTTCHLPQGNEGTPVETIIAAAHAAGLGWESTGVCTFRNNMNKICLTVACPKDPWTVDAALHVGWVGWGGVGGVVGQEDVALHCLGCGWQGRLQHAHVLGAQEPFFRHAMPCPAPPLLCCWYPVA